ncbi:MAG TPA: FAD-dependent oxidoreductase [Actinopolymorphaceae bacterium]
MKVLICGAGLAGLALAHCLDAKGWQVVVLEKAPGPRTQGYMIDFFGPGYDAVEAMGLLPRVRELGYRVEEASYVDRRGRRRAALDFGRFAKALGGRLVSIMRPDLERVLREALPGRVDLRFGTSVVMARSESDGVRVELSDGSAIDADLLVGADGIHSTVRRLVTGDDRETVRHLGFHTAAFVFDDAGFHAQLGNRFYLTDTIGRQMGFYGLRDGRVAAFAVHRARTTTLPADARAAIREEYASLGWLVPRALAACPPAEEVYYDLVAQVELAQWSRGRITLVGDACYAVSLLAGQGASLGIGGAYVLAEQLDRAGSIDAALEAYERQWRPVVVEKQRVARSVAGWFVPESEWKLFLRRTTMRLSRLPGVRRRVAGMLAGKPIRLAPTSQ